MTFVLHKTFHPTVKITQFYGFNSSITRGFVKPKSLRIILFTVKLLQHLSVVNISYCGIVFEFTTFTVLFLELM